MCMCLGFSSKGVGLHSSLDLGLSMSVCLRLQVVCMHCHLLGLLCLPLPCAPMHTRCCCCTKQAQAAATQIAQTCTSILTLPWPGHGKTEWQQPSEHPSPRRQTYKIHFMLNCTTSFNGMLYASPYIKRDMYKYCKPAQYMCRA